ncbi:hypothetical protein Lupro_02555 [Lutibacter profundi]|uniref:RNA-directed DNA polymerase n=1 Tax=Lutibacter profundi TaxID=1622118 RepID=A0A0X8G537_9FLAO|nr:reverse transcriptase family protein [Lutibacter profundi]AMC10200.1 hypothetical protein Lupro_02555 [Lutibacter profundi]
MKNQKLTLNQIKRNDVLIKKCKTSKQIASLLNCSAKELTLHSFEPIYYHFKVPKKRKGAFRYIEAPSQEIKHLQRKLNYYLQSVYYLNQSKASYGYIIKAIGQKNTKNIYTNALQHLGSTYMLNADFKDFFHQIALNDVVQIFKSKLFNFNKNTAYTLAKICTYKGRLPMGAPTSPALSNLYSIALDHDLSTWATLNKLIFTRFVDDLSFSSKNNLLNQTHFKQINNIALKYHLNFNPNKTKYFSKTDKKIVTGLVLNNTVDIDKSYYNELDKDINRLQKVIEVHHITGKTQGLAFLKEFKQQIMGKINFISTIEGKNSKQYLTYLNSFHNALEVNNELVNRWTKFSNYI